VSSGILYLGSSFSCAIFTGQTMIISIIGLAFGAFLGYLLTDFMTFLAPVRQALRGAIDSGRQMLVGITGSMNQGPLIQIGIMILLVLLVLWLIGFSTAVILGFILGVVYNDKVEAIPFVSGIADSIKSKLLATNKNSDGKSE
jgi:uncharacterized membrane protein